MLSGFFGVALQNGLPGDGIMEAGLDILQKLPERHPGLFYGSLHLSRCVISNLAGHAAEPRLLRCSFRETARRALKRVALPVDAELN